MGIGARGYDPAIGRFITQDRGWDWLNWYEYAAVPPVLKPMEKHVFTCLRMLTQSMFALIMPLDKAFADAVNSVAAPELSPFAVELQQVETGSFVGTSRHVRVGIGMDRYGRPVFFTIKPEGVDMPAGYEWGVDLWWVLLALAPEVQFSPKWVRSAREARWEVQRQTKLLIRYCGAILDGDTSNWHKVDELVQLLRRPDGSEERWRDEMRNLASEAYTQGNYQLASRAYFVLGGYRDLTGADRQRARVVQRQLERHKHVFQADEMPE